MIQITRQIEDRLRSELTRAGKREIGGVLMGECLEPGRFKVLDLTVQRRGGTAATFIRSIQRALHALADFFHRTDHNYTRFNYLGEWHTHPSLPPFPSREDIVSAQAIADDPDVGAHFVALLILRQLPTGDLEGSATFFRPGGPQIPAALLMEDRNERA